MISSRLSRFQAANRSLTTFSQVSAMANLLVNGLTGLQVGECVPVVTSSATLAIFSRCASRHPARRPGLLGVSRDHVFTEELNLLPHHFPRQQSLVALPHE